MAGMTTLALIAGGTAIAGGLGNYFANKSAAERAEMLQNEALQEWIKVQIPDPEEQKIALESFVQQGTIVPKLEKSIQAQPSEFAKIVANPAYAAAQNKALTELSDLGHEGGLRLQDKAALQDAEQDAIVKDRAQREGIAAEMARRGMGGSGYEVAAQLQGQQGTADRMARSSLDVAANAQDRALQAIIQGGELGAKYRGQEFDEKSAKASAADKINLFNTQNLQDVQQRNIASMNAGDRFNLEEKQRIADQNTKQKNFQQQYNKELLQKQFENRAAKTSGMTGQYKGLADTAMQQGQNLGNLYSNFGQGASQATLGYGQMQILDDYFKKKK